MTTAVPTLSQGLATAEELSTKMSPEQGRAVLNALESRGHYSNLKEIALGKGRDADIDRGLLAYNSSKNDRSHVQLQAAVCAVDPSASDDPLVWRRVVHAALLMANKDKSMNLPVE